MSVITDSKLKSKKITSNTYNSQNTPELPIFAERLLLERKNVGYSQEKCSELLGISRDTLSKWENGHRLPNIVQLREICMLFDCDTDYMLGIISERTHDTKKMMNKTGLSKDSIELLERWNTSASPQVARIIDFILSFHLNCIKSGDTKKDFINSLNKFLINNNDDLKYNSLGTILPPNTNVEESNYINTVPFDDVVILGINSILKDMKTAWRTGHGEVKKYGGGS